MTFLPAPAGNFLEKRPLKVRRRYRSPLMERVIGSTVGSETVPSTVTIRPTLQPPVGEVSFTSGRSVPFPMGTPPSRGLAGAGAAAARAIARRVTYIRVPPHRAAVPSGEGTMVPDAPVRAYAKRRPGVDRALHVGAARISVVRVRSRRWRCAPSCGNIEG